MNKILLLYYNRSEECVTGGQIYEEFMYECLNGYEEYEVMRYNIRQNRSIINKLLAPLANLKYLSLCKRYDMIITNSVYGWYFTLLTFILKYLFHKKVIIIHHHFLYLELKGIKRFFYKVIETLFLKSSSIIVAVSPYIYDLCKIKFKNKNLRLWTIPFDNRMVEISNQRQPNELLYMGTIEPRKGLSYLLESLKILQNRDIPYHLRIVGKIKDSSYYTLLKKEIDRNSLNVDFLGFVSADEKDMILRQSSVFVFPSMLEGFGMVLCEVMRYGMPVICFDNSAMPYTIKSGYNGYVVENKNYIKMAEAIELLLSNDTIKSTLIRGCYESISKVITHDQYRNLLRNEMNELLQNDM